MLDDDQLEQAVRDLLLDICEVMSRRGYEMVSVGAMMRLVGIGDDRAAKHDDEYFSLDDEFRQMLSQRNKKTAPKNNKNKKVPRQTDSGATIH